MIPHESVCEQQPSSGQPLALSTDRVLEGIWKQEGPSGQGTATAILFAFVELSVFPCIFLFECAILLARVKRYGWHAFFKPVGEVRPQSYGQYLTTL